MGGKLKVTAKQSTALDVFKSYGNTLQFFLNIKQWGNTYQPIREFSIDMMARAIYIGYEIEQPPPFTIKQWATRNYTMEKDDEGWLKGYTFQIVSIEDGMAYEKSGRGHCLTALRYSTKEEAKMNRLILEVGI